MPILPNENEQTVLDRDFLKSLSHAPGVYQMLNAAGDLLYVGKAKNLKKRVSSYFRATGLSQKTQLLVQQITHIKTLVTRSETEALLLESNLIKKHHPKYNILLRDDKSYPYLYLSTEDDFPRLDLYRGAKTLPGRYFGPYPSISSVRETLNLLQKLFRLRQCEASYFQHRTRPCLQHQIQRCTAPCVGLITKDSYAQAVHYATLFLEGKSDAILQALADKMEAAAAKLAFEEAAHYRDQITHLRRVQERQMINQEKGDSDVLAVVFEAGLCAIARLSIREGQLLGGDHFFPRVPAEESLSAIVSAFIAQYYLTSLQEHPIPQELIVNVLPQDKACLEEALSERSRQCVSIHSVVRGVRADCLKMAVNNAITAHHQRQQDRVSLEERFLALKDFLKLSMLPERLVCFDVSHTQGEATVASCVVFTAQGPEKKAYRRFNIEGVQAGDDYAALEQAIFRYLHRVQSEETEKKYPNVVFVDGGLGQWRRAQQVLQRLGLQDIVLVAIAKGPTRKPGLEVLFLSDTVAPVALEADSPALHLIQHLRDESHRFAIAGHRAARAKKGRTSTLESIPGVGAHRRRALLRHFGGLQEIKRASLEELQRVSGVSIHLAQRIYDALNKI